MAETRNVYTQINKVMEKVGYVQKTGKNTFQNYKYASDENILNAIRDAMVEEGLVMYPNLLEESKLEMTDDKGKQSVLTTVKMEYRMVDCVSGTEIKGVVVGYGKYNGDKGCYKAMTGAKKYFISQTFALVTGDDPEKDESPAPAAPAGKKQQSPPAEDHITDSQKQSIGSLLKAKEIPNEEYLKILKDKANKNKTINLTKGEASKVIEALTAYNKSISQ